MNPIPSRLLIAVLLCISMSGQYTAQAITLEWSRQFGTGSKELSGAVSTDGLGNVYVTGATSGDFGGPSFGGDDAFLGKYDAAGTLLWTRQFGTQADEGASGVSADALGNVFVLGATDGNLGGPNSGLNDIFLAKYDASGNQLWTRQIGTPDFDYSDGQGVAADGLGNVYVAGTIWGRLVGATPSGSSRNADAFVSKVDATGQLLWTRQFGTAVSDIVYGASADGLGNVYISGRTDGSLGGTSAGNSDVFIAKYDDEGNHVWTRQLGSSGSDYNWGGISADDLGNIFISGATSGNLGGPHLGLSDAFVAKYDATGQFLWTRQFGTSAIDSAHGVSADGLGNVYISGYTRGSLDGLNAGGQDLYVRKYDAAGILIWSQQLGSAIDDSTAFGGAVSSDGVGNVFIAGYTMGSLGGPHVGDNDVYLAKFSDRAPGDFNTDGTVDAADYIVWRKGLGTHYSEAHYAQWRANFGTTAAGAATVGEGANSAVPEPGTFVLVVPVIVCAAGHRRGINRRAVGAPQHLAGYGAGW